VTAHDTGPTDRRATAPTEALLLVGQPDAAVCTDGTCQLPAAPATAPDRPENVEDDRDVVPVSSGVTRPVR